MRLTDRLVKRVKVGRKSYRLKTDFRNVLGLFDVMQDKSLTEEARLYLMARKIINRPPKNTKDLIIVFMAAKNALIPPNKARESAERVTDFEQDADMIRAAFRQVYGIDLYRDRLHWTEFTELLNNLPEGTRYSEIVGIRARPLPEATKWNAKQRQALIDAKLKFAIGKSEDEVKKSYNRGVNYLANSLLRMARKGSDKTDV